VGPTSYLAFLGVSLVVICTPGQDTALTIRNTLIGGRGRGGVKPSCLLESADLD
jgi:threonine/homoserine/homoserine lactone efflux protein